MKLLTPGQSNKKMSKNAEFKQYDSYILHLAPASLSGYNTCPAASNGCKASCLNTAGNGGRYPMVQEARIRKTRLFFEDNTAFMSQLVDDIGLALQRASKTGKKVVIRLNGTSDIAWENILIGGFINIFEYYPQVTFYDYTKRPERAMKLLNKYENYHLTFSVSESNHKIASKLASVGVNVAAVFRKSLPKTYWDTPVIDGTKHDLRFLDSKGVIVGLIALGKARSDKSGFVIDQEAAA